jgi:hypothetical protein
VALFAFKHKHWMLHSGASKLLSRRVRADPKVAEDRGILATGQQSFENQARFVCGQFSRESPRTDGYE